MAERMTSGSAAGSDRPDARRNDTEPAQGQRQREVPRMPHEHDESADSQAGGDASSRSKGEAAYADVERGVADTTRGGEMDATYHELRKGETPGKGDRELDRP
jgi:hypothetical protein